MVTLALLQPVAALSLSVGGAAAAATDCVTADDLGDELRWAGDATIGASPFATLASGTPGDVAWRPDGRHLVAVGPAVHVVDPSSGGTVGSLAPPGSTAITGLVVDPVTLRAVATEDAGATSRLFSFDAWTGGDVQGITASLSHRVRDLALDDAGTLWAVVVGADGIDHLARLDDAGGVVAMSPVQLGPSTQVDPPGLTGVVGTDGLAALGSRLIATTSAGATSDGAALTPSLLELDATGTGYATVLDQDATVSLTGLGCAGVGSSFAGVVSSDPAGDATATPLDGATVELWHGGSHVQTTTTAGGGAWTFSVGRTGAYSIRFPDRTDGSGVGGDTHEVTASGTAVTGLAVTYRFATVAGVVFDDLDGDGVRDDGEPGVTGVTLSARIGDASAPTWVGTAGTDVDGAYAFADVPAGDVVLTATAGRPAGPMTTADAGGDGEHQTVAVAAGAAVSGTDVGYDGSADVVGTVWNDLDGDGAHDAGEPGLADVGIVVRGAGTAATPGPVLGAGTTQADGTFAVGDLAPGSATVEVDPDRLPRFAVVRVGSQAVELVAAQTTTSGDLFVTSLAAVTGRVVNDVAGDGADATDRGFAGVAVELHDGDPAAGGMLVASDTTDATGAYELPQLSAGDHWLTIPAAAWPAGASPAPALPLPLTLGVGEIREGVDVAFVAPTTIEVFVFDDLDGDGTYEPGAAETPLSGLTVSVADGSTGTDVAGVYTLGGLPHGDHELTVAGLPAGAATIPVLPATVTTTAGQTTALDVAVEAAVTLDGRVFSDRDGDATYDPGVDGVLSGATVTVASDGGGSWTATTGTDGTWTLASLPRGTYDVSASTSPTAGVRTTVLQADIDATVAGTYPVDPVGYRLGAVAGVVFGDLDGDGTLDVDEAGLVGVDVTLRDADGVSVAAGTTDTAGAYRFDELAPGTYAVVLDATDLGTAPDPGPHVVEILAAGGQLLGEDVAVDRRASLAGTVWNDLDGDGIVDDAEPRLADVTVAAVPSDGTGTSVTVQTDASGSYLLGGLLPGTYRVDADEADLSATPWATTTTVQTGTYELTEAEHLTGLDIGYDLSGDIAGVVFNDVDGDAAKRAAAVGVVAEPGIDDVTVTLLDADGAVVGRVVTAGGGAYRFDDLRDGEYQLLVSGLPAGEDPTVGTGVTVGMGTGTSRDLGFDLDASTAGLVYDDVNGDGDRDAGEPPLAGAVVVLRHTATDVTATRTTGSDGAYAFTDLVPGGYSLDLEGSSLPSGAARTQTPAALVVTLAVDEDRSGDLFGVEAPVHLAGRVANDLDGDGDLVGEPGLAGVQVQLLDGSGSAVGDPLTVDPDDGGWAFGPLAPGTWTVAVVPASVPAGATQSFPDPATAVAGAGADGTWTVTLAPSTSRLDLDVGYDAGATISGRVWDDLDGDAVEAVGEPGLDGIAVEALDGATVVSTVPTVGGAYEFVHLPPGTYTVRVAAGELDPAYVPTTPLPTPAVAVTVAAAEDGDAAAIGYWRPSSITFTLSDDGATDGVGPDVDGVDVTLLLDGGVVATLATGPDGRVVFDELAPGTYTVDPATPARYVITGGSDPWTVTIAPDEHPQLVLRIQEYAPLVTVERGAVTVLHGEAGDVLRYPFRVRNDGNVADTYSLTTAADPAATVRVVAPGDDPDTAATTSTGEIAPGDWVDLELVVTVPAGLARGDVVDVTVTATGSTADLAGDVASGSAAVDAVVAMPVVDVEIDGGAPDSGYVTPGTSETFTITLANGSATAPGPTVATARDVTLALGVGPLDAATVEPGSITVNGVADPSATFPLAFDALDPGTRATVTFRLAYERPLADGTVVTLGATATATGNPEGDPREDTDTTSDTVSSSPLPEASLSAVPRADELIAPGDVLTYTVAIGNVAGATDTWTGVRLVGALSDTAAVTGVVVADAAADPADLAPGGTGVPVGDLAPGSSVTVVVTARVADPIADASVVTAVFEATGTNGGPLVWATSHTVEAHLGVSVGPDRHVVGRAGSTVLHPHVLANTGNVTTVFDLAASTDLPWATTVVIDADADGALDDDELPVDATPPLPGGGSAALHLLSVVEVPADEPRDRVATTTLAAFSRVAPPEVAAPAIAQAFAVTEVVGPDLVLDVAASPASTVVNRGQVVTYTTTVRNDGRAGATGTVLTDPTPADATYVGGSARIDGEPVPDGPGATNPFAAGVELGSLAEGGGTRTVSFQVTVGAVEDGTPLVHQASVVADDGVSATGSVTQTVSASPVLDVVLSSTPAPSTTVTAGAEIAYTAVVTNRGTLTATGVTVRQPVPDRTGYVAGSTTLDGAPVADAGGTTPLGAGLSLGALAPDASRTVRFRVRVADPVFDGEAITATATVSSQQGVTAASETLRSIVDVRPAISLTGGGSQDVARPGQAVHPHTVRNAGDVTDTFTLQGRSDRGWTVSLVRDDDGDGSWDPTREITPVTATGPLTPGGSLRFFAVVEVTADAALGSADTTSVTARSVVDPGVTAVSTSRTRATAPSLELAMSATPSGDHVNPGASITYVLSVRNRGAAPATEVVVTSTTPTGTTYVPDSATTDGVRVPDGTASDGNPLTAANGGIRVPSIAPGGELLVTFAVAVPATATAGQVLTANASVTATATTRADASKTHTVAPGPALDLTLVGDPPPGRATPAGTRITYTLTVRNIGQETATDVRVVADTPRDTTYLPGSTRRDGTRVLDGLTDPNPLSSVHRGLAVGDLTPGGRAVTLTYAVVVDDPVPTDATVTHRGLAVSDETSATSDRLVHTVAVRPAVTVTPDVEANAVPAGFADLAHTVTNVGDVTDVFALSATSAEGWVTSIHTDRDGDGDIGTDDVQVGSTPVLGPGEATTIVVRVAVPEGTPIDTRDAVRVTATSGLDPTVTGEARDVVVVVTGALRLTKTAAPLSLTPGARSTYTLTVRNVGTAPAAAVTLSDAAPDGTRYVAGSTRRDGTALADVDGGTPLAGGLVLGTLAAGAATTLTFTVETLADPGRSAIVNSATVSAVDAATTSAGTVQPVSRDHGLDLSVAPELTVSPGTTVVRPHVLASTGAVADEVELVATSRLGLPVAVHLDPDGDGAVGTTPPLEGPVALAPGEQVRVLVVVHYGGDVPEGSRDEVVVTARSAGDPRIQVSVTDVVHVSTAEVTVLLSADPDGDVAPGEQVAYEVVVTNRSASVAPDVTVLADTPAGTVYVPGSATIDGRPLPDGMAGAELHPAAGPDPNPLAGVNGGVALGDLAPGAVVRLGFVATVASVEPGATLAAVAGVQVQGREAVTSNTVVSAVADGADLQVLKSATPSAVAGAGEVVTWTLSVLNLGTATARDVVVTDPPAAGTRYVPGSTTVDGRSVGDGLVTDTGLPLGDVPAGGTRVVAFRTVLDVPGALVQNVAAVTSAGSSVRPLSNLAAVSVGGILPATGIAAGGRTLGGAAVLLVSGWMLLYVARPERRPVPVLRELAGRAPTNRRRRTTT